MRKVRAELPVLKVTPDQRGRLVLTRLFLAPQVRQGRRVRKGLLGFKVQRVHRDRQGQLDRLALLVRLGQHSRQ